MKSLYKTINEAKNYTYTVQFIGFEESVEISVPLNLVKQFDKFLEAEEGNIFSHVSGYDIEY